MKPVYKGLIPLRSGSKSIPNKNIKDFCGKPLFYWAAKAAIESGVFNGGVYIATDSQAYVDVIMDVLPQVHAVIRPPHTATDSASSESVMDWFVSEYACDVISLIQATSPGVKASDFRMAYELFEREHFDSLLTGVPFSRFIWNKNGVAINYDPAKRPRRQDFEAQIMENGSFYFTNVDAFLSAKNRICGRTAVYEMNPATAIEIDDPDDWESAERLFRNNRERNSLHKLKILVVDIDGTLTDGGMYYAESGELLKKFNTRDGAAMARISELGIQVVVCTGENSPAVSSRMRKLGVEHYFSGIKNKSQFLSGWLDDNGYAWDEVGYVGDELNDEAPMQLSSISFCPNDANPIIKDLSDFVLHANGGEGVLREVLEIISQGLE